MVTAAGVGLGGASGASVANAYVRTDKSFGFERIADGDETTVIFANGFLSEGKTGWGDWERTIRERYPDATVYRLTWGAKELKSLTALVAPGAMQLSQQGHRSAGSPSGEGLGHAARSVERSVHGRGSRQEPVACGQDTGVDDWCRAG